MIFLINIFRVLDLLVDDFPKFCSKKHSEIV